MPKRLLLCLLSALYALGAAEPDPREDFEATFRVGASIDSFAGGEIKKYFGYASAGPQTGFVAGVDFAKRLTSGTRTPQLWLFGATAHGQRTSEVDCSSTQALSLCSGFSPATAAGGFLAILRNASSLEAFGGLRLEFLKITPTGSHAASLYAKTQMGFITVAGNGGDIVDDHVKLALGLIMTNGGFRSSYFEAGWGRSDLFFTQRGRRLKFDGCVQWRSVSNKVPFHPFLRMTVDADMGPGSDSIRSYYGIAMDIRELTCAIRAACPGDGSQP
jgi:hypothetical protein